MRDYEVVYIFRSALETEEIESKLERFHEALGRGEGQVTAVHHWGRRQLAYPIQDETNGYYVVAQFAAEPAVLPDLEQILKLDEDLLRHLIVLSEGELPPPPSMQEEEPDEEEEEDEDEEEDDEDEEDEGDEDDGDDEDEEDEGEEDEDDEDEDDDEDDEEED